MKTAIQWLEEKWHLDENITVETFDEALKIEKEQIEKAFIDGHKDNYWPNAELYYTVKYKL
jgi:hypothetical protein